MELTQGTTMQIRRMFAVFCCLLFAGCLSREPRQHLTPQSSPTIPRLSVPETPLSGFALPVPPLIVKKSLTKSSLQWGEKQLVQMLHDRPALQGFIQKGDPVWTWVVRQFAGEGLGGKVEWCNLPMDDSSEGETIPETKTSAHILIGYPSAKSMRDKFYREHLWATAIYELNNVQSVPEFFTLRIAINDHKINQEGWINRVGRLEYLALRRTKYTYLNLWAPLMKSRGIFSNSDYYLWGKHLPDTYEKWMNKGYYKVYSNMYKGIYKDSTAK
ncbi:MAG: hypothetical protein NT023_25650 [Armatimonadetes bacterium]|nr:hypothetical protein [Armatimonadota bacterium]